MDDILKAGFDVRKAKSQVGKRKDDKPRPTMAELTDTSPWSIRQLHYYATVPVYRWRNNSRWSELSWQDQGLFLILCDWLWMGGCVIRIAELDSLAGSIGIKRTLLGEAIDRLIQKGFLYSADGLLIQLELRAQQLGTIGIHGGAVE